MRAATMILLAATPSVILAISACRAREAPATSQPASRSPEACAAARAALDVYLAGTPRGCTTDPDCRAQYVRADPCARPVVTAASWSPDNDGQLRELQRAVIDSCAVSTACEPVLVTPACRLNVCVDNPGPSGVARSFCSPTEGLSWSFSFTVGQEARCDDSSYPRVTATLWSDVNPAERYRLDPEHPRVGVLMRCRTEGQCEVGSGSVRVTGLRAEGFVVELEGTFGADALKESFLARRCPGEPTCG